MMTKTTKTPRVRCACGRYGATYSGKCYQCTRILGLQNQVAVLEPKARAYDEKVKYPYEFTVEAYTGLCTEEWLKHMLDVVKMAPSSIHLTWKKR